MVAPARRDRHGRRRRGRLRAAPLGRSESEPATSGRTALWGGLSLVVAAVAIALQLAWVFGGPAHISQTFDAIVHLNTVAFAVDTGNASAFHIGLTSDIGFYPTAGTPSPPWPPR